MRVLIALLFMSTILLAGDYTKIFIPKTIPTDSQGLVSTNIYNVITDSRYIVLTNAPQYFEKADTNNVGYLVSVRTDTLGVREWRNMPLPQIETKVSKGVRPPHKQLIKVLTAEDFKADYEPVPTPAPSEAP